MVAHALCILHNICAIEKKKTNSWNFGLETTCLREDEQPIENNEMSDANIICEKLADYYLCAILTDVKRCSKLNKQYI